MAKARHVTMNRKKNTKFMIIVLMVSVMVTRVFEIYLDSDGLKDPTTVVNILMSIGLCIDFATHVGYRIYRSKFTFT